MKNSELDENLQDTATSPINTLDAVMAENDNTDPSAKGRLPMNSEVLDEDDMGKRGAGQGAAAAMLIDGFVPPEDVPEDLSENKRKKRSKKVGAGFTSLGSAGYREETIWSQ